MKAYPEKECKTYSHGFYQGLSLGLLLTILGILATILITKL